MSKLLILLAAFVALAAAADQKLVGTKGMGKDVIPRVRSSQNGQFLYGCTSNDDCKDTIYGSCHDPSDPNGSFCDCVFMGPQGSCHTNKDCCDNMCENGQCKLGGGRAGTVCSTSPNCKTLNMCCGDGCSCNAYENFGFCTCP